MDSLGTIYVADTFNSRIQKFDSSGVFLIKWGTSGTGNGQFYNPVGVAADGVGNVYVTDYVYPNNRVQKFNSSGVFQAKWGPIGTGNGQFQIPWGVSQTPWETSMSPMIKVWAMLITRM